MTDVVIVRPEQRELRPADVIVQTTPSAATVGKVVQVVSDGSPYVHIARVRPGDVVAPHSHSTAEVTVVLDGSMIVGEETLEPGTVLVIPAGAVYGFAAGEDGLDFVVVRPERAAYVAG